jgi:hypothetical protein
MDQERFKVVYSSTDDRWHAVVDGKVRQRAKTKESAEKTIRQIVKMEAAAASTEQAKPLIPEGFVSATAEPPSDPFETFKDFSKKFDGTAAAKAGYDVSGLIPAFDETYVPFGPYKDLDKIITSGIFYPVFISGPSGNGKSSMVEQICHHRKKPLIRVNLNMMVDEDVLIGSKTLKDGNVQIVEGPVLIAMRTGATLLLDEIDAGGPNTLLCLQPILEGKPYYFKLKNEIIIPAPGFNIMATGNTKGKGSLDGRFAGTNILNEAFLERFAVTFNQEYPDAKVEEVIINKMLGFYGIKDPEYATLLAKWADSIRKTNHEGGVDETMSTRRLGHIVRAYAVYRDRAKAVELCCNRFDHQVQKAFLDLYKKMQPESFSVPRKRSKNVVGNMESERPF